MFSRTKKTLAIAGLSVALVAGGLPAANAASWSTMGPYRFKLSCQTARQLSNLHNQVTTCTQNSTNKSWYFKVLS